MPRARLRRIVLPSVAAASVLLAGAAASGSASTASASGSQQQQTCPLPIVGADPDTVTLTGPTVLRPANGHFVPYTLTAAETPGEKGDGLPHGVTISYSISLAGSTSASHPATRADANPPTGATQGDFSVPIHFQLRARRTGTSTRTYEIAWTATFDGGPHTCSSSDAGEHPFTVTVPHTRRRA